MTKNRHVPTIESAAIIAGDRIIDALPPATSGDVVGGHILALARVAAAYARQVSMPIEVLQAIVKAEFDNMPSPAELDGPLQ